MEAWRHGDDGVLIGVDFSLILGGDWVGFDGVLIGLSGDRFLI